MKCDKINQFSKISPSNTFFTNHHCIAFFTMSLHINMTEKCALLSKGFFPHCDTHLCIFCDLRPGNFLIVYLPPSSFYKFLFDFYLLSTSLPNWLLLPLWNKGPSTDYDMMEEMCGKRPHSKRDLSPELLILFKWYEFWSFHNLIRCKVCRESIMCPLYPRHQPPTSHKRCLLWPRKSLQKKRLPPYLYFANVYGIIDSASFMRQLSIFWMGGSICLHIFTHHWHFLFHKKNFFILAQVPIVIS